MTQNNTELKTDGKVDTSIVFVMLFMICGSIGIGYAWYEVFKETKNQAKDVYKHPNVVIKKTPDTLILRDIHDNKERIYLHNMSAKTYCNLNVNDTVYFHSLKNYDKNSVFHAGFQTAFKTKQR